MDSSDTGFVSDEDIELEQATGGSGLTAAGKVLGKIGGPLVDGIFAYKTVKEGNDLEQDTEVRLQDVKDINANTEMVQKANEIMNNRLRQLEQQS